MMVCCAFVGRPTADCRAGVGPISSCFFLFLRPTTTVAVTHRVHSETHRIVPIPSTRSVSRSPPFTFLRTASKSTQVRVRVRARANPVCLAMMSKVKKKTRFTSSLHATPTGRFIELRVVPNLPALFFLFGRPFLH